MRISDWSSDVCSSDLRSVSGRLAGALEAVPGAVLTAIIAPMVLATGPAETAAAGLTVLLALRLPLVVAVAGGCLSVTALRDAIGSGRGGALAPLGVQPAQAQGVPLAEPGRRAVVAAGKDTAGGK